MKDGSERGKKKERPGIKHEERTRPRLETKSNVSSQGSCHRSQFHMKRVTLLLPNKKRGKERN